eukprot:gene57757-biopygen116185
MQARDIVSRPCFPPTVAQRVVVEPELPAVFCEDLLRCPSSPPGSRACPPATAAPRATCRRRRAGPPATPPIPRPSCQCGRTQQRTQAGALFDEDRFGPPQGKGRRDPPAQPGHRWASSRPTVSVSELPIGIAWRLGPWAPEQKHRSQNWRQPFANTECQNDAVVVDWHGDQRRLELRNNVDNLTVWINADRTIDYYVNAVKMYTAADAIPANKFPIDFVISDAGNVPGYYRNLRWVIPTGSLAHWNIDGYNVSVSELPIGIAWRRSQNWGQPFANTECKDNGVLVDWHGDRRRLALRNNVDNIIVWINANRTIDYYVNDVKMSTAANAIPANKFPVDFVISDAGNVPGQLALWTIQGGG